jgi:hypothetical protein
VTETTFENIDAYTLLWTRVLHQSVRDALAFEVSALRWFLAPPPDDLVAVCRIVERDPAVVRRQAAVLVLSCAKLAIEDQVPRYDPVRGVTWEGASEGRRMIAGRFLRSDLGEAARRYSDGPVSTHAARALLGRACSAIYE